MSLVISPSDSLSHCTRLIIVCGHATYLGDGRNTAEDQWILQDFQRSNAVEGKASESETFVAHIALALLTAQSDPQSLIVLSGGRTTSNPSITRSEAAGYGVILAHLAHTNPSLFSPSTPYALEEHATDSYQNLLFSLLRFRTLTGRYPAEVLVVTHAFKQARFLAQHAPALKWPAARIRVAGLNPPFTAAELEQTAAGEQTRAFALFAQDLYGVWPPLADKRRQRNWDAAAANAAVADGLGAEVMELLRWSGGESRREVFPGRLPWQED